ncbi:acylneuraminate cytidylyltransferase family protein [Daejeonella sp. H1SJ63]|uniref:acylneuraminate cytidylyltransferase family protein n=1 Tax=Daejeonella sp. H1SJ63 TaxID=3034145 RepID=UPI0023EAFABC|nr:acylneuraminate cytidylyltransferase family protein [Daejeonella sp. H1SJ63]
MNTVAIILARGGSKGIPKKNIIDFCGKPLIAWTIENCIAGGANSVWVSSDSDEILKVSEQYGAKSIKRPDDISDDFATSEKGWLHAIDFIGQTEIIDWVLAPQVTSPLREAKDIALGIKNASEGIYDSFFSCSVAEDLFFWQKNTAGQLDSVNYDWRNRKRRQDIPKQYIENGSFYMFRPEVLRANNNRFGSSIGIVEMEFWKMFEIDSQEDLKMCSALMKEFLIH